MIRICYLICYLSFACLHAADDVNLSSQQEEAIAQLQQCKADSAPDVLYGGFNEFCKAFFGAEHESLIYKHCGDKLKLIDAGNWTHASVNSAVIGFETNLPAQCIVEYGKGSSLNQKTNVAERSFYIHVHYLKNLEPNTKYTYRLIATDERGNTIKSKKATFTTKALEDYIAIPGDMGDAPYKLTEKGKRYLVTQDITCNTGAFIIENDNITLDLNGHTVTYGKDATEPVDGIVAHGTVNSQRKYMSSGVQIVNGHIVQGDSQALQANKKSTQFKPFYLKGGDAKIAGLSVSYHGPQIWGMTFDHPRGSIEAHHNVLCDKGGLIKNRHGAATRAIGFSKWKEEFKGSLHHNLVKRTRQNGIGGVTQLHHNEIYVDSFSTNSFAVQAFSKPGKKAGDYTNNRIFGTGFNPYGFGWAHEDYKVSKNIVHFQGIDVSKRWHETWGDINMLEAMRVTNYGKGGQVRNNLKYTDNLIVIKGGQNCEIRGTGFFSDVSIEGLEFNNNTVKVIALDNKTKRAGCVSTHGHTKKPDSNPVWYKNNTFISNICFIRFGDAYAKGHNHFFQNNKFIRVGKNPNFHSFQWGGSYWSYGHRLIDSEFVNATHNDVYINKTGTKSHYFIQWSLAIEAKPGYQIEIKNKNGEVTLNKTIDTSGKLTAILNQCRINPVKTDSTEINEEVLTPHQVSISNGGAVIKQIEVTMDKPQTLKL